MASRVSFLALARQSINSWSDDYASSMGAALAYYTLFSLAPLLLLVIAIATARGKARRQVRRYKHARRKSPARRPPQDESGNPYARSRRVDRYPSRRSISDAPGALGLLRVAAFARRL